MGAILLIAAGAEEDISSGIIFGIGFGILLDILTITVTAAYEEKLVTARVFSPLSHLFLYIYIKKVNNNLRSKAKRR